jgi:hypothetical protein
MRRRGMRPEAERERHLSFALYNRERGREGVRERGREAEAFSFSSFLIIG